MNSQNIMTCDVCNITTAGEVPMRHHLEGRQHMKMVARNALIANSLPAHRDATSTSIPTAMAGKYDCVECRVSMNGPECYQQHIMSAKHMKKMAIPDSFMKLKMASVIRNADAAATTTTTAAMTGSLQSENAKRVTATKTATPVIAANSAIPDHNYADLVKEVIIIDRHENIADVIRSFFVVA